MAASEFDGGGIKLGLEGTRYGAQNQFFVYGKGYTSFVAGTFRTNYQLNRTIFNPTAVLPPLNITNTNWEADRIVTILDLEAGIGWHNFTDNLRLSVGYMVSQWFNTVKVNEWINAVQQNNFVDPSDNFKGMIAFDGLTAKIELLW